MSITVTRALTELKTLDKRIQAAQAGTVFVSVHGQIRKPLHGASDAAANYQSICDLIERRRALKAALTISNATTCVKVCDLDMTVAEAIEMKSSVKHRKTLLATMKSQYSSAISEIETTNERHRAQLQVQLGTRGGESGASLNTKELSSYSDEYMKVNGLALYDPISIKSKITQQENFITEFENQIDHVLSEKNATTCITI